MRLFLNKEGGASLEEAATYWNHNVAFHQELVEDAARRGGRVLDIGCGEGLLLEKLAACVGEVVGIDPDEGAVLRARKRLISVENASVIAGDFMGMPVPREEDKFQTITCVATLHHMELEAALRHVSSFLAPGGKLLVVGLAADKSAADLLFAGLVIIPIRIMDKAHGGVQEIDVRIAEPRETLSEIRRVAQRVLTGAKIRRRFYYRYTLSWVKK